LFLAPFLLAGLALAGVLVELLQGRLGDLVHELPMALGMLLLGAVLAVLCWLGVFSWHKALLDGRARTVLVESGAWPRIRRRTEPAADFRAVSIEEHTLMEDRDGGSSVWRQAVQLLRKGNGAPLVLDRCDSYAEAQALAKAASTLLRLPMETRKRK